MSFYNYWGKSDDLGGYHLLAYHSLDVAAVGQLLLQRDAHLRRRLAKLSGLSEDALCQWLVWMLFLHDLGKFSEGFQDLRYELSVRLRGEHSPAAYNLRHDSVGHQVWKTVVCKHVYENGLASVLCQGNALEHDAYQRLLDPWVRAVTGHHGEPPKAKGRAVSPPASIADDVRSFVDAIGAFWALPPIDIPIPGGEEHVLATSAWLVGGFSVLCDWLGSNRDFFPYCMEKRDLADYWEDARERAQAVLRHAGVLPAQRPVRAGMDVLFPTFDATPVQALANEISLRDEPTLLIIEELTGAGKTEAALTAAQRLIAAGASDGIYFALPTMATANAMHRRVEGIAPQLFAPGSEISLVLAHSASRLRDVLQHEAPADPAYDKHDETTSVVTSSWLADNRKKALLASLGVGTVDQALLGVLPARHNTLRLLGLHRKVLVVDEVHAYDGYTGSLLARLLQFHAAFGGSAVLLSATLPAQTRRDLIDAFSQGAGFESTFDPVLDYPLVSVCRRGGVEQIPVATGPKAARRVAVEFIESDAAAFDLIISAAAAGQCACWIRNSVNDAIESYELLRERMPAEKITLFHARFTLEDRLKIENQVLGYFGKHSTAGERAGRVVIATQVVEQSLDLDFDVMVTDLAPIDLIIQRAGRLRRHPRTPQGNPTAGPDGRGVPRLWLRIPPWSEEPEATWVSRDLPRTALVYPDHGRLWLTAHTLRRLGAIDVPKDARELIESVYGYEAAERIPNGLDAATLRAWGKARGDASLAHLNALNLMDGYSATPSHWLDDARTPTRLGELTTNVRLARHTGEGVEPLAEGPRWRWSLSQVSVAAYLIHRRPENDTDVERAVEKAEESMPDKGKWSVTLPLREAGDRWVGEALNHEGQVKEVTYCRRRGLRVSKGDSV